MERKPMTHSSDSVPTPTGVSHESDISTSVTSQQQQLGPAETANPLKELRLRDRWLQAYDVHGTLWEVREARPTKHGFDLLYGKLVNPPVASCYSGGPNRLIVTPALLNYWETHRLEEGRIYDIPAGRTTIKRARLRLHLNFVRERTALWRKRLPDLQNLSIREFSKRHNVPVEIAKAWRYKMFGRIARPLNWWHDPAVLEELLSGKTLKAIGVNLGISTSQVHRLRARAQELTSAPVKLRPAA